MEAQNPDPFFSVQTGAQISLADVGCAEERRTRWYNLLSHAHMPEVGGKGTDGGAPGGSDAVLTHTPTQAQQSWILYGPAGQPCSVFQTAGTSGGGASEDGEWPGQQLVSEVFDEGGRLQGGEGLYPQSSQWEAEQQQEAEEEEEEVIRAPPVSAIPEKVLLSSA